MRKLMWFTLGFGAACAFGAYLGMDWVLSLGVFAGLVAAVLCFGIRVWKPLRIAAVVAIGLCVGCLMLKVYDSTTLSNAKALDGQTQRMTVIVHDYSFEVGHGYGVDGAVEVQGKQYRVRVYLNEDMHLQPGNRLQGEFQFRYTSTGGMEEVLYHRSEKIYLMAYQQGNLTVERCWSLPILDYPVVWRQELLDVIDRTFEADTAGFAKALLLGDRSDIDYETETAFKVSGISHIIAVSGLHLSILFALVNVLTFKRRYLTAIIGITVSFLFAAIVGFTPSVTRAAVMQSLMLVAMVFKREYDGPTELAFSALVMLVWNPLVIASVSFQLSFACMAGIFLFAEPIWAWLCDEGRLGTPKNVLARWFASSVSISLAANVVTMPLVALYFGTVSLVGVITNLLTLWVISGIFYGLMAVCVLGFTYTAAAGGLAWVIGWLIRFVLWVSKTVAVFPLAAVYTKSVYIVLWLVGLYALLAVYMAIKKKPAILLAGLALVTLCVSLLLSWTEPLIGNGRMTVLDVGQGQAIILQSEGKTFLVDCGGDYDDGAADMVAETLLSQGIGRVDGIILTHYDRDHAGGVLMLLTRIQADAVLLPFAYDQNGVGEQIGQMVGDRAQVIREDTVLAYGNVKLTLFAPESYNSGNESSMCVLFQAGECDILITGDRGIDGERLLLNRVELPQVDALVVGHHGAKNSTSMELLETVRPQYAFISVEKDNPYDQPALVILERLEAFGCEIFRTDEDGTIIFRW